MYVMGHWIKHWIVASLLVDVKVVAADIATVVHDRCAGNDAVFIVGIGSELIQVLPVLVHLNLLPFSFIFGHLIARKCYLLVLFLMLVPGLQLLGAFEVLLIQLPIQAFPIVLLHVL